MANENDIKNIGILLLTIYSMIESLLPFIKSVKANGIIHSVFLYLKYKKRNIDYQPVSDIENDIDNEEIENFIEIPIEPVETPAIINEEITKEIPVETPEIPIESVKLETIIEENEESPKEIKIERVYPVLKKINDKITKNTITIENINEYINERNNDFQLIEDSFKILNDKITKLELLLTDHSNCINLLNESAFDNKLLNNKINENTTTITLFQQSLNGIKNQIEILKNNV